MNAEIVSVGTELLLGQIVDTHAPTMARILADCGITCTHRQTVGDNFDRLVEALRQALARADVVITIGGLGPTQDDLTRDGIAAALGDHLVHEPEIEAQLREIFRVRKLTWAESNLRQAQRPSSGRTIDNPNGTAPGLICDKEGKAVIALPGPRSEFNPMAEGPVKEYLSHRQGDQIIHSRTLRICGIGESSVEAQIKELMDSTNPTVAPYAHTGEVHLRLTAKASTREEADNLINPVEESIRRILGNAVYGVDEVNLETAVVGLLGEQGHTVAVAESMTGGGLGERFTSVAGAGSAFLGGVITYSVDIKHNLLDIDCKLLEKFGPVSYESAEQMARQVRLKLGATYGISITGNAGPTSDVDGKPVGLTYIGVADEIGCRVEEIRYRGAREDIRKRATQSALVMLRENLLA